MTLICNDLWPWSVCPAGRVWGDAVTDGGEDERSGAHAQKPQTAATGESVSAERAGTEIHTSSPDL